MTDPDEQVRCAFSVDDHIEFEAATTSERRFLEQKYDRDITDFDVVAVGVLPREVSGCYDADRFPTGQHVLLHRS